jgi:hypothetical protein
MTDVSSSTIRRIPRVRGPNWVRRDGHRFEATPPGAFVATAVAELVERIEVE